MKHTYTMNDGLRMMGQLLLHNPTTGVYYRKVEGKACYCFIGAGRKVADTMKLEMSHLLHDARQVSQCPTWADWDEGTDEQRGTWAKRLAEVGGP